MSETVIDNFINPRAYIERKKKILLPELSLLERPEFNSWYFRVPVLLKGVSP